MYSIMWFKRLMTSSVPLPLGAYPVPNRAAPPISYIVHGLGLIRKLVFPFFAEYDCRFLSDAIIAIIITGRGKDIRRESEETKWRDREKRHGRRD